MPDVLPWRDQGSGKPCAMIKALKLEPAQEDWESYALASTTHLLNKYSYCQLNKFVCYWTFVFNNFSRPNDRRTFKWFEGVQVYIVFLHSCHSSQRSVPHDFRRTRIPVFLEWKDPRNGRRLFPKNLSSVCGRCVDIRRPGWIKAEIFRSLSTWSSGVRIAVFLS